MCCKVINYLRFFFSFTFSNVFFPPSPSLSFLPPSFLFFNFLFFCVVYSYLFHQHSFPPIVSHLLHHTLLIVLRQRLHFTLLFHPLSCCLTLLSIVSHLCFMFIPSHFTCYSYLSTCYFTFQVATLPFDLLFPTCVSFCVVLCFISPYYILCHLAISQFLRYLLPFPPLCC
jgi:hypothetical protein